MQDLHKAMEAYIERHPDPERGMKHLQQYLQAKPDIRKVTQLLPIHEMETRLEYIHKIEKGQRAFHENRSWGFTASQYVTLMNLPLETLESYAQHDAEALSVNFEPMRKFLAHFFKREQSGERPETSQAGFSEPAGPSASEKQEQKENTGVCRSEARELAKHYDKDRCVVTGLANPQGCHIVPFTWNSTNEHLQTATAVADVIRNFFRPDDTLNLAILHSGLGASDKNWNLICLSPQLQKWWSHAYFGLKYLGHVDGEKGMSTAELQFVWMPHSHYDGSKRIDLDEEKDKASNIRVCLEHVFGGEPPCSPYCDRCTAMSNVQAHKVQEHYTIESGYVFPVVRKTEDIEKFKTMIQLQWAAICVGSISGAANYPEFLVGDDDGGDDDGDDDDGDDDGDGDDDDSNDNNQPLLVASVSQRIEDWLDYNGVYQANEVTAADIRRLEDAPTNPWTGEPWPQEAKALLEGRRKLPVYEKFDEILKAYHDKQVFVLSSETASGKSTQVPQLLAYDEYAGGLKVACTQPHRLATTELATRVAAEMGVTLGHQVGYQIGGDAKVNQGGEDSRLVYMTEGILLRKMLMDADLSQYGCVILDEAHERSVEMDVLIVFLKYAMRRREDLKVVIMSATVNAQKFQDYFDDCQTVSISGGNFKIETLYVNPAHVKPDYRVLAANVAIWIHKTQAPGNILIFLPGQNEINKVCESIRRDIKDMDVRPLYAQMPRGAQRNALNQVGSRRKCIVSTNIAETSLTIDGIVYVIYSGVSKQAIYNVRLGMHTLRTMPISQASAKQRTGRAGRVQDGICFRLYSKKAFNKMPQSSIPAVSCDPLHGAILKLLSTKQKVLDFDWIDYPHSEAIARALADLKAWGFVGDDGTATASGRNAARAPIDPIWFRALEVASEFGCTLDMLDLAAVSTSQRPIFTRPPGYEEVPDATRRQFATCRSDHLAMLNAFSCYLTQCERRDQAIKDGAPKPDVKAWCERHFLDKAALDEACKIRNRVGKYLSQVARLKPSRAPSGNQAVIVKALATAFCTQLAIWNGGGDLYRTVHEKVAARIDTHSALIGGDWEWVVYTKLTKVGERVLLQQVSAVPARELVDLPYLQESNLPMTGDGTFRMVAVKRSLEAARAKIEASKSKGIAGH
ncbi:unnamed protein product [Clonostachys rosea]|uniref:Helicase ATP-binding domain-containing protein n=1 Tax=Bionectria ochroleuca TaxID=29856 RepID=A0ABY6TYL2_BIOOC|nr:unnamed protein product [Clonostachys rosea]